MKTQLPEKSLFNTLKLKLIFLILFSLSLKSANALLSSYGLSAPTATLDPMSGGTITTLVAANQNDLASAVTSIGFTFTLNSVSYTQFSVNSNGLMRLGSTVVTSTAANSLASSTDLPKIAAYWDDLKTVAGTVRSKVLGISPSRTLVVDWNVTIVNTNTTAQFQVWLFEGTNNIQFVYGAGTATNAGLYSVGLATSTTDFSSITVASTFGSSTVSTVTANNSNSQTIGASNSFLYTPAPTCPVLTSPASNATNVSKTPTLTWTAGTTGTTTLYDVYFGTAASPPLVSANQAGTSYSPPTLLNNTVYFWKVIGKNGTIAVASSASCSTIQFTTLPVPNCATSQSPTHLSTNKALNTTLSWVAGAGTVPTGYDVYFGTAVSPPLVSTNQVGTTYNPGTLISNTNYYWKIVPRNGSDLATGCSVIQFTTVPLPTCATSLSPAHLSTNIALTATLNWAAGAGTVPTGYDVYFGTAVSPPIVSTNQVGTTYNPGTLISNTNYYWKIVPRNGSDLATGCTISQFTTVPLPTCATSLSPANLSTNKALNTTLSWVAGAGTVPTGYDVYFGTAVSPPIVSTNQVGTTYNPGTLISNTNYYWKIVPRNGSDLATGCTIIQFTTVPLPTCAASLSPADLSTNKALNTTLSWVAGAGTVPTGYDVYFGTAVSPPLVSTNQVGTTYNPGTLNSNTNYYWKIVPRNGSDLATGCSIIQFTTVVLPNCAASLSPAHLSTNIALNTSLSWVAGSGLVPTGYDVYFGTAANPPLVATNNLTTSYSPGTLSFNTTYFWKIVPRNGSDLATGCSVIQFTTIALPNCATSQSPTHLSTNKALNTTLSWVAGSGTVPTGYDVYFGTAVSPPLVSTNQVGTTYNPGTLISNTNYYWKIVPRNGSDLATGCSIFQFTTVPLPTCAASLSPAHLSTNKALNTTLSWVAGAGTVPTGYDVYFGTAVSPPLVSTNQVGTTYNPGTLISNTNYYWKIVPRNGSDLATGCTINQFTTVPLPTCAASLSPAHLSTNKALNTTLSWVAGAGTVPTGYDVYFGTAVSPPLVSTNQAGTTYNPGTLISNTNYYWKIVPRNGSDLATGCTISQFTTVPLPSCAASLSPAHLATLQPLTTSLTWTAGAGTVPTGYDVYFGTAVNPPLVSTNQAGTSFNPGALISSTNYYWKIVPRNGSELATGCAVSQFTTVPIPNCATGFNPAHLTTNLPLQDTLKWTAGAGTAPTGYDIYFGTAANPPLVATNNLTTSYFPGYLSFNTTYYWKIVPRNGADLATGCSINQFSTRLRLSFDVTRTKGIAYSSISSTGLSVPAASWRNGTVTDDNLSNALPIGFNFTYNGGTYSNFLLGVNGFITLNTATTSNGAVSAPYGYNNGNLSGGSPTSPLVIAPFYEDITCQGQQSNLLSNLDNSIKYKTTGSVGSRVLTVEWIGMETFNTAGPNLNFQLKIYEGTNIIEFIYGNMDGFDGTFNLVYSYSVGISASAVSTTPQNGEFFDQDTANTRSFGSIAASQLTGIPECYSRIRLTPGNYTPYSFVSLKPTNDSLGTPIHLNVNATPCIDLCGTYYKTNGATKSRDATCGGTPDDDVWFDFTAINANTTIKVAGSGGFDAVSELFNNSMVSLACANTSAVNGLGLTETITSSSLVVGQKYFVRVFHKNSGYGAPGSGEFSICVSGVPSPPINDNCSNSITLPISPSYTIGTNTYAATASSGIPSCGLPNGENPDDDVWYKFTAAKSIEVITVAGGNGFDAVIQLLSGTCNGLSSLSCVNNFGNGQVETMTVSGLTINAVYFVRVFHKGIGGGSGSFSISVSSPPPSCSDLVLPPNGELNMSASGIDLIWDPVIGADNYIVKFDTIYPPVRVLTTTTDTTVYTGILKQTKTYYWQLIPGNGNSYNYTCEKDSFSTEETPVKLTVRVFLQNLYLTNRTMKNLINPADTIADTIVITLYDAINEFQYASIAFLSTNGWAAGYFPLLALDSPYYFVVSHRNSVETWSSTMFMMTGDSTFDFSSSPSAVWGGNVVQVQAGVYAMICGDMNQDGYIDKLDVGIVGDSAALFQTGFVTADFNADSIVESLDLSQLENKVPLLIKKRTPFPPFGP